MSEAPKAVSEKAMWQKRYTIVGLCFAAMVISFLDRVNISIASLAMQEEFGWNEMQKGMIFSAFFAGYFVMQIVGGVLANKLGGKLTLGLAVIFWSVFTILSPIGAVISLPALLVMRFALGVGEAALAPSAISVFVRWVPEKEMSRTIAFFSSGATLGTVLALVLSGRIIEAYGWPAVFYIFGAIGFVWAFFWFRIVENMPEEDALIDDSEKAMIISQRRLHKKPDNIPWKLFFSRREFWALYITYFCVSWSLYFFLAWMPTYFAKTFDMSLQGAGMYSLLPWVIQFFMIIIAGIVADKLVLKGVGLTFVRKLLQSLALFVPAGLMYFLMSAETSGLALTLLCIANGFMALSYAGSAPNSIDLAPRYSDVLYGVTNTFGTFSGVAGGLVTGILVQKTGSFEAVFMCTAIIQVIGGSVFVLWGSAERIVE